MKKSSTLLILFIITTTTLTSACSGNCGLCSSGHCIECYQRPFANLTSCASSPAPSDHCDLYFPGSATACSWCSKGFALDLDSSKCVESKFTGGDCVFAFTDTQAEYFFCTMCNKGYPNQQMTQCISFEDQLQREQNIEGANLEMFRKLRNHDLLGKIGIFEVKGNIGKPTDNCMWGFRDTTQQVPSCVRCNEGFTQVSHGCVKQTLTGCAISKDSTGKTCGLCDVWNGWFMHEDNGPCKKGEKGIGGKLLRSLKIA